MSAGFEAVSRQSLAEAVFAQLRDRILRGELRSGEALPSERLLAELLGVNRGAVREGLQRLQQARLITVRHGGATQVRDWRREAGLDMLPHLLVDADGQINVEAARGILALRQALAPVVAAAAASQPNPALAKRLAPLLRRWQSAADATERQQCSLRYWSTLVDGAGNIAYRLAFNSLQSTYRQIASLLTQVMDQEFRDTASLEALGKALGDGDSETARRLAADHVALGTAAVGALLDRYAQQRGTPA